VLNEPPRAGAVRSPCHPANARLNYEEAFVEAWAFAPPARLTYLGVEVQPARGADWPNVRIDRYEFA
jgi:hypothetical protein